MNTDQLAYSVPGALEACGNVVGRTKFYDALKHKRLKARKIGRRTVILADDLKAWLQTLPAYEPDHAA